MRRLTRAAKLTSSDWRYLIKATIELLVARIRLSAVATERLLRELKSRSLPLRHKRMNCRTAIDVERLSWAIALAARYVPWRSDCLIQVMAADRWMRRNGLCTHFHLGVAKDAHGALRAHAWLCYGDFTVTGGKYDEYFPLIEPSAK